MQTYRTPYNSYSKYESVADNLLCTHCGCNSHLKERCETLRRVKEKYVKIVKSESNEKGKRKAPDPSYRFSKNTLPLWTRRFLVNTFDSYWELRMKWVPKTNK